MQLAMFATGLGLQQQASTDRDYRDAKVFYGLSVAAQILSSARFFTPSKRIGPLLIVMKTLINDVFVFFALFSISLLSYGAVLYGLVFAQEPVSGRSVVCTICLHAAHVQVYILYYPFFSIFGNTYEDQYLDVSDCMAMLFILEPDLSPDPKCSVGQHPTFDSPSLCLFRC